ncbi:hypothetical protein [Marinomonas pollencensis]|uniref:Uncharacterized protein n=1 Tax=Marinomonas pollencensis TaxID=491954 RepID=A0A3E0DS38_9GAMM|nr:hypothetical protein [Marinomonas pollencensis]REG85834.1 hypothetical protein DFP81_102373 [Marinomonas pollencensis]
MTIYTKSIVAFLASLALASTALASAGDLGHGTIKRAQANIGSLEARISNIELSVDTNTAFITQDESTSVKNGRANLFSNILN